MTEPASIRTFCRTLAPRTAKEFSGMRNSIRPWSEFSSLRSAQTGIRLQSITPKVPHRERSPDPTSRRNIGTDQGKGLCGPQHSVEASEEKDSLRQKGGSQKEHALPHRGADKKRKKGAPRFSEFIVQQLCHVRPPFPSSVPGTCPQGTRPPGRAAPRCPDPLPPVPPGRRSPGSRRAQSLRRDGWI